MRIRHQSLVMEVPETAPYFATLAHHADAVKSPGTVIEINGLPASLYPTGMGPAEFTRYLAAEHLLVDAIASRVVEADRSGFDAFMIATLQDPGLQLCRTLTDIPVVGYGQASALIGRCFGERIGVLAFNRPLFPLFRERINAHNPGIVGPIVDLEIGYDELMASFATLNLRDRIEAAMHQLVDQGATVIVTGQMVLAEVVWAHGIFRVRDVPVFDGFGALVKLAESLVTLRRASGMTVNRCDVNWLQAPKAIADRFRPAEPSHV